MVRIVAVHAARRFASMAMSFCPCKIQRDWPNGVPASVVLLVIAVGPTRCLATVIGESGFEAQANPIIGSRYSGVCFEIKFSGRHRGFDGVLLNM